jgi:hypothetical protein
MASRVPAKQSDAQLETLAVAAGASADRGYLETIRAMKLILAPGQVTELRALGVSTLAYRRPHTVSGYFDDIEALAQEATEVAPYSTGVYFTPNLLNPALLARASNRVRDVNQEPLSSDGDVVARRWLLVDIDAIRPAGISSTDAEHDAAIAKAGVIREALAARGWPQPILADSGNGAHLLYRIDLPADDGGVVKRALEALAAEFDDENSHVDTKVFNPARIWKLYGTVAHKGDDRPERPHRMARILEVPGEHADVNNQNIQERSSCQLN